LRAKPDPKRGFAKKTTPRLVYPKVPKGLHGILESLIAMKRSLEEF
jgi:hypothetical protein